jgi:hypothetical protein
MSNPEVTMNESPEAGRLRNLADEHYTLACHADTSIEADRHERLAARYEREWQKVREANRAEQRSDLSDRCNRDLGTGQRCDNVNGPGHLGPCGNGPWR